MSLPEIHLEQLYQGFLNTSSLWTLNSIHGLYQLQIPYKKRTVFKRTVKKSLRLGQLAEQFAFNQLDELNNCKIIAENLQIQKERQTLGELDAIIESNKEVIHLELIYKFYLYDEPLGTTEIERWIGPNRNDSLIQKITKLKNKQLPLLYSEECKSVLNELKLDINSIQQRVLFKAQLFVPYQKTVHFTKLNEACVCGFYLHKDQLEDFNTCQFYIPPKLDWFLSPSDSAEWQPIESFKTEANLFLKQHKSPLIWIKKPNGNLLKCFLVWW